MKYETRAVLAGTYPDRSLKSCLTHSVMVSPTGAELVVLCGNVKLDSIADKFADDANAVPTCKTCARKLTQIQKG